MTGPDVTTASDTPEEPPAPSGVEIRADIMHAVANIYAGQGDACDAHRFLGMMIMLEYWLLEGGDGAAKAMNWEVHAKPPVSLVEAVNVIRTDVWPPAKPPNGAA